MNRTKTVIKNAIWEMGYYFIVIALGFLAPRYIILIYGSEVNGLTTTITQIINLIMLLQAGATTAAVFSLYKPVEENNLEEVSKNIHSAGRFFKKISFIFVFVMIVVALFASQGIASQLEKKYIFAAFLIMGLKSFLDLYFTSKFRIVFTAYQEKFVISIATLIEQLVYYALVFSTIFLRGHYVLLYIWFFAGCVVKVVYLNIRYEKKYGKVIPKYTGDDPGSIKGRSYSLANEVSHSAVSSSITIILSFMYGLQETSVYAVYALVGQALYLVSTSLWSSFAPSFGSLVAAGNSEKTGRVFGIFQLIFVMFNSVMYYCMIMLVAPFAGIYTKGATDINYINVTLACLLGLQGIISAYRIPYNVVVSSCGFFKETWKQPVICAVFSMAVSYALGKIEYAFILWGPIVFYIANFVYQHFCIKRLAPHFVSNKIFVMLSISMIGFALSTMVCISSQIPSELLHWIISAVICLVASIVFVVISTGIALPQESRFVVGYIKTHFLRSK